MVLGSFYSELKKENVKMVFIENLELILYLLL